MIYEDCPFECPKNSDKRYDLTRRNYCDACPRKKLREKFKKGCNKALELKLGSDHGFDISSLEEKVLLTARIAGGPDDPVDPKLSVRSSHSVAIYRSERHRAYKRSLEK